MNSESNHLAASLRDLLSRLKDDRSHFLIGEEATKQGAVLPILARLGWDRDNIREVIPNTPLATGGWTTVFNSLIRRGCSLR